MDSNQTNPSQKENVRTPEASLSKSFIQKLKVKWGLESIFQVMLVLLVFSITGTTVVFLRENLFAWLGFDENTAIWVKTVTYILFVFPAYQTLLLFYGSLCGQFDFFWSKEKKMFRAIKNLFTKK